MVQYYPGPYEVEIAYEWSDIVHLQRLNCTIAVEPSMGDQFVDIMVTLRDGSEIELDAAVDDYIAYLKPMLPGTANIIGATLWKYTPDTYDRTFKSTYPIEEAGTNAGAVIAATQEIFTYRTLGGSRMRINVMEGSNDGFTVSAQSALTGAKSDFADYFLTSTCFVHARDNTFAGMGLRYLAGQNEALYRRRYRA